MQLTQGKTVFFDKKFLSEIVKYTWCAAIAYKPTDLWYAITYKEGKRIYMHKVIKPEWEIVDHIDGNALNNRSKNLRNGSGGINARNQKTRNTTTGVTGVTISSNGLSVCARWHDSSKKLKGRSFSIKKYGFDTAMKMAVALRRKKATQAINEIQEQLK